MKIGDRVYVHGYVDEIRKDCVIIHNDGGYFGTVKSEIIEGQKAERRGKWIRDNFGSYCSACDLYAYRDKFDQPWESPYCPICGAKMEIERNDE